MSKYTTRARVRLTIELVLPDAWGGGCPPEQVFKQASEAAEDALRRGLIINRLTNAMNKTATQEARVLDSKVTAILFEQGDSDGKETE